jgi:hypothetical protein
MCQGKSFCLCHLIRRAIENDEQEGFKLFFQKSLNNEQYFFLKTAYELQEQNNNKLFITSLDFLVAQFINKGPQQINLSHKDKLAFLEHYDAYIEEDNSKKNMLEALATLIQSIEKLTYQNLATLGGFKNYLNQYNVDKTNNEEKTHHNKKSKCLIL